MKIIMLRSKMGSNDGATTKMYDAGEEYEVSEALGLSFIEDKVAKEVDGTATTATKPEYIEGQVYHDEKGDLFVGIVTPGSAEVGLLPIEQLGDDERAELIKEGKLKDDGTAVDSKAIEAAPKNKAIGRAPKNKAK